MKLSIFCPFGLKTPIYAPKNWGFRGISLPKMGSNVNETPKRHILARVRVVWAIQRENPSSRLACRCSGVHPYAQKPWTDLHQICHSRRGRRRNHMYHFLVIGQGVSILWGSKIAISHWQSQSPLTQGWRYCAARDQQTCKLEHSNSRFESIRFDWLCKSIWIDSFTKKSAFRFISCHAVFSCLFIV